MKNIHLIPTDKPSRLYEFSGQFILTQEPTNAFRNYYIYITSDEEFIEEGDSYMRIDTSLLFKSLKGSNPNIIEKYCKKIILTTDADLIKDGVQAIDDEFLEWFVKNPSCEEADVNDWLDDNGNIAFGGDKRYQICNHIYDKIIIPQEELKQIKCYCGHTITCDCEPLQETLEETAERLATNRHSRSTSAWYLYKNGIIEGAKWQAERSYSEEDMIEFAEFVATYPDKNKNINGQILHAKSKYDGSERTIDLLEQFKKII